VQQYSNLSMRGNHVGAEEMLEGEKKHRKDALAAEAATLKAKESVETTLQATRDTVQELQIKMDAAGEENRCVLLADFTGLFIALSPLWHHAQPKVPGSLPNPIAHRDILLWCVCLISFSRTCLGAMCIELMKRCVIKRTVA
jgi:hypothetical protein